MSVLKIQPNLTYVQDDLRRIQDNLGNAIEVLQQSAGVFVDAGHYAATAYPGGEVTANVVMYDMSAGRPFAAKKVFVAPQACTIVGAAVCLASSVAARTDVSLYSNNGVKTRVPALVYTKEGVLAAGDGVAGVTPVTPLRLDKGDQAYATLTWSTNGFAVSAQVYLLLATGS